MAAHSASARPAVDGTRPRPVKAVATSVGAVVTVVGTIVSSLVTVGALNTDQGDATQTLLGLAGPATTAIIGVLIAFGIWKGAEPHVTPVHDPRDTAGNQLTPVIPPDDPNGS